MSAAPVPGEMVSHLKMFPSFHYKSGVRAYPFLPPLPPKSEGKGGEARAERERLAERVGACAAAVADDFSPRVFWSRKPKVTVEMSALSVGFLVLRGRARRDKSGNVPSRSRGGGAQQFSQEEWSGARIPVSGGLDFGWKRPVSFAEQPTGQRRPIFNSP